MTRRAALALLAGLAQLFACPAALAQGGYAARPEVRAFIRDLVETHGFVERELVQLFSKVRRAEPVLQAIVPPPPRARSWQDYRALFVNERRLAAGVEFWSAHRAALERAEQAYGVPAEYMVSIIGIETFYGRNMGRWRVFDALTTLAFDYPPRAPYFRGELENFLLLARDQGSDVFAARGSYAGAMGIPQFMPGSVRRFAVDFDGSGRIDLRASSTDAIGSVANFLREHGWRPGEPVSFPARVSGDAWRPFADGTVDPKHPPADLRHAGVEADGLPEGAADPAALIELPTPGQPSEFRLGLRNFWVITRYNRSAFYASAVEDLAVELRRSRGAR